MDNSERELRETLRDIWVTFVSSCERENRRAGISNGGARTESEAQLDQTYIGSQLRSKKSSFTTNLPILHVRIEMDLEK